MVKYLPNYVRLAGNVYSRLNSLAVIYFFGMFFEANNSVDLPRHLF